MKSFLLGFFFSLSSSPRLLAHTNLTKVTLDDGTRENQPRKERLIAIYNKILLYILFIYLIIYCYILKTLIY